MNTHETRAFRTEVLRRFGAGSAEIKELLDYTANRFTRPPEPPTIPLADEAFVPYWQEYAAEASSIGVFAALRKRLIQLNFPVQVGISNTEVYRQAVRRGVWDDILFQGDGVRLSCPEGLQLVIHQTPAGKIPVIIAAARDDFVALLQALMYRNEPEPVPESQGAAMLAGYNNWDRIRRIKAQMQAECGEHFTALHWAEQFKQLIPQKERYQDRFILLSREYYSGVPPEKLGLEEEEWREASLRIRREHESVHYVTKRLFGSMRNNMLDELLADCAGIVAATGYFCARWFLTFIGLENYPFYRQGGRLQNYRGTPPLSDGAFQVLQRLVYYAARRLETVTLQYRADHGRPPATPWLLTLLTRVTLEQLAVQELFGIPELAGFQEDAAANITSEPASTSGELSEEELEHVAGGITWGRGFFPLPT